MASQATRGQQTPRMFVIIVTVRESEDKGPTDIPVGAIHTLPWYTLPF